MATNLSVFNKSIDLIVEFLNDKGFSDISLQLQEQAKNKKLDNPNDEYFPNAEDVTKLERIFATNILTECIPIPETDLNSNNNKKRNISRSFKPVTLRDVEDEWESDEEYGYTMKRVHEKDLNAYAASEYEAMTLPHESYEHYPVYEMDENTLNIVNAKLDALRGFPEELKKLARSLGITDDEYDNANDDERKEMLLEHFQAELGIPVSVKEDNESNTTEEYESYYLKIIQVKNRTGFQETKDFPIIMGDLIAGRYQVQEYLGSAAFSTAIQCYDFVTNQAVCLKVITNNKDFLDQSLDEIKLLSIVKNACNDNLDDYNLLRIHDYFYYKEHLFLVTELLRDNLYEFYSYNLNSGDEIYFNLKRLKSVAKQILVALEYIHNLGMIHCDLKPENILIKSYSRCLIKVIDLGSSCFIKDHLSSYIQSRSYRAPEVILGLPYGRKIDIWSVGCILAELFTGEVLFLNDTLSTLLARVEAIIGTIPAHMKNKGAYTWRYFTNDGVLYDRRPEGPVIIKTKQTSLKHRLDTDDKMFLDFMTRLLRIDPAERPTASEALSHPWLEDA